MNMKQCALCQGYTEYYCHSCQKDLCQHCKAVHVIDLETKHHEVTFYREKSNYIPIQEKCVIHPYMIYDKYCEFCEVPVCGACSDHRPQGRGQHKPIGIRTAYQTKRQQNKGKVHIIRSETLYYGHILLRKLRSDVNTDIQNYKCEISRVQSEMLMGSQRLKELMDSVIDACNVPVILDASSKYKSFIQKIKVNQSRFIDMIQKYEGRYDQSSYKPVKFLRFIKQVRPPLIQDTPQLTQHRLFSVTQEINMGDLNELLRKIQITERGKRKLQVGNELLLTQMSSPVLQKSLTVTDVGYCRHIVCVSPNRVWISDRNKIILVDTETGVNLCTVEGLCNHFWDSEHAHTASPEGLLFYVDESYNINTFSVDEERSTIFINNLGSLWKNRMCILLPFFWGCTGRFAYI